MGPSYTLTPLPQDSLPSTGWTLANDSSGILQGVGSTGRFLQLWGYPSGDTLYYGGAYGPFYMGAGATGSFNDYAAFCAVSPSGNVDGVFYMPMSNALPAGGSGGN
jgi:hypothetical protein